jgi:hypothetical protein
MTNKFDELVFDTLADAIMANLVITVWLLTVQKGKDTEMRAMRTICRSGFGTKC